MLEIVQTRELQHSLHTSTDNLICVTDKFFYFILKKIKTLFNRNEMSQYTWEGAIFALRLFWLIFPPKKMHVKFNYIFLRAGRW